jgi:hypothetical protein
MEAFKQVPDWLREIELQLFAEDKDAGDKDKDDADTDTSKDKDKDKDKDGAGDKDKDKDSDQTGGDTGKKSGRTFTQDELDSIVRDRLKKQNASWEKKIADEKKKAEMTEAERAKAEREEAEKKLAAAVEKANQRLIRAEVKSVAADLKIIDADAAFALMDRTDVSVEDDDRVVGVRAALESLIKSKPYLVGKADVKKTGDDQVDDKGKKGGFSMNDLIRKAAGRT